MSLKAYHLPFGERCRMKVSCYLSTQSSSGCMMFNFIPSKVDWLKDSPPVSPSQNRRTTTKSRCICFEKTRLESEAISSCRRNKIELSAVKSFSRIISMMAYRTHAPICASKGLGQRRKSLSLVDKAFSERIDLVASSIWRIHFPSRFYFRAPSSPFLLGFSAKTLLTQNPSTGHYRTPRPFVPDRRLPSPPHPLLHHSAHDLPAKLYLSMALHLTHISTLPSLLLHGCRRPFPLVLLLCGKGTRSKAVQ